ncbi:MAG TPA: hypothetical protein DCR55_03530 [Lentisphaeria bacterium]|nr:hypothetical protein [Lentisphaeria bacterium]
MKPAFLTLLLAISVVANEFRPTDAAIDRGLAWLATAQAKNGAFAHSDQAKPANAYTGLAVLAFLSSGHLPGRSAYSDTVTLAVNQLLKQSQAHQGYLGADGGRMYGHAIATLALSQAYGQMPDTQTNLRIQQSLTQATAIMVAAQNPKGPRAGGWHYERKPKDADLSVSCWQMLALRAVRQCQISVPQDCLDQGAAFIWRCHSAKIPGFSYRPEDQRKIGAMRAAGIATLSLAQPPQGDRVTELAKSAEFLGSPPPKHGQYYYYELFYRTHAAVLYGGDALHSLPGIHSALLGLQRKNGAFAQHSGFDGGVYSTAFAILALSADYQLLPAFSPRRTGSSPS